MRTAAKVFFVATAAAGCLALSTMTTNCGGSSGERPTSNGGTTGAGGANIGGTTGGGGVTSLGGAPGAGGTTASAAICANSPGLICSAAVVPANLTSGGVTDLTDWNPSCYHWGSNPGLYGAIYDYADSKSNMKVSVDGTPKVLHFKGTVASSSYGGGGLSFYNCATVAGFTQVQFTVTGSSPGCDLELQIQTFDQRPTTQSPAGGCDPAGNCYGFPVAKKVAVLPAATPTVTTKLLSDFSGWSIANANQVVGLQWQFTGTQLDPDAGPGCPVDVTITDVKFLQ
jgi:hypothetical protein